jgi:hypothetical protein
VRLRALLNGRAKARGYRVTARWRYVRLGALVSRCLVYRLHRAGTRGTVADDLPLAEIVDLLLDPIEEAAYLLGGAEAVLGTY